ncbi:MAG TPA: DUF3341 domain-containing protein [Bacteroidales bacterium]|nr:DUF3341 domain-containing protein [Bacteroidales bacterium]
MIKIFEIGVFDNEEKFISAIRQLNEKKVLIHDVFSPYPIHEVFHLLKRKSRLPLAAYLFGLLGVVLTLAFLYYTSVISWPINYGGKPFNSFPSFIVVTIVVTIFTVTILSLGLFSIRSKLVPGRDNTVFDLRATDDKFIIVVEKDEGLINPVEIMQSNGAVEVSEKKFERIFE